MFRELQQRRAQEAETEITVLTILVVFIGLILEV